MSLVGGNVFLLRAGNPRTVPTTIEEFSNVFEIMQAIVVTKVSIAFRPARAPERGTCLTPVLSKSWNAPPRSSHATMTPRRRGSLSFDRLKTPVPHRKLLIASGPARVYALEFYPTMYVDLRGVGLILMKCLWIPRYRDCLIDCLRVSIYLYTYIPYPLVRKNKLFSIWFGSVQAAASSAAAVDTRLVARAPRCVTIRFSVLPGRATQRGCLYLSIYLSI